MIRSALVVCTGNICRSPFGACVLRKLDPELKVSSAGISALVGRDMDSGTKEAAAAFDIPVQPHRARQMEEALGRDADVILVMERRQREEIARRWPHLRGKTFLVGEVIGVEDIPDPYRQGRAMHFRSAELVIESMRHWSERVRGLSQ